jgi:ubiquitin-conjugating enzyme E2 J1
MAKASQSWRCSSCGKSNEEILKACEEAAKLVDTKPDELVPKELKMGWKDEMGTQEKNASASHDEDSESAELAEGFVGTAPVEPAGSEHAAAALPTYPPARPAQGVPQPTAATRVPPQTVHQAQQRSNDGVPSWVDKAIVGILVCLIVMILKQLL